MACIACARQLHDECLSERPVGQNCCCSEKAPVVVSSPRKNYKADDEITVSAGRKRAAVEHSIDPNRACEWKWKKNCGGGKYPIIGCIAGVQEHRHHGPVKNTARNESTNVHLICTNCHNRWHTLNDKNYDEELYSTLPHSPIPASLEECSENEIKWKAGQVKI